MTHGAADQVGRRIRTLIIDDDEDMRMLAASIVRLSNAGLEVVGTAEDAEAGLASWRALKPDVVVLDHRMPGASGLEVASQMLAEQPGQPIILFSAYIDTALSEEAARAGVCAVLDKDRFNDLPATLWECVTAP